jgi:hypothetical protein
VLLAGGWACVGPNRRKYTLEEIRADAALMVKSHTVPARHEPDLLARLVRMRHWFQHISAMYGNLRIVGMPRVDDKPVVEVTINRGGRLSDIPLLGPRHFPPPLLVWPTSSC